MSTTLSIINEAKRLEEDSLHSSKAHFAAALFWGRFHYWIGIPATVLSAAAGATAFAAFDSSNVVAGVTSIIVAILSALATFINPQEKASHHLLAGNQYNALKNSSRIFYTIEVETKSENVATDELKKLRSRGEKLNKESPQIPTWAFAKAKKGIDAGEANYRIDN